MSFERVYFESVVKTNKPYIICVYRIIYIYTLWALNRPEKNLFPKRKRKSIRRVYIAITGHVRRFAVLILRRPLRVPLSRKRVRSEATSARAMRPRLLKCVTDGEKQLQSRIVVAIFSLSRTHTHTHTHTHKTKTNVITP